ncbi:MAG: amidohydrolase family protein [Acidobacteriota bacterium]|nr:amidohydrolase family protein [Acidobacteriota bacterium]
MKRLLQSFVAMLLFACVVFAQTNNANAPFVFTHVTVIDVTGAPSKSGMTVIIAGNRIEAIGKTGKVKTPKDAQIIDATGKFLIPGLWDMHVHTGNKEIFLPLYIANGITGVRDMGGDLEEPTGNLSIRFVQLKLWKKAIAEGTLLGPRIVAAGFMVDGAKPTWQGAIGVANEIEARQAVDVLASLGVDFIKVYSRLSPEAYFAIADEAKKQHIPFAGHVPRTVSAMEASDAGQKSIEHFTQVLLTCSTRESEFRQQRLEWAALPIQQARNLSRAQDKQILDTYSEEKSTTLFAHFRKNETWQVPTLSVLRTSGFAQIDSTIYDNPLIKYVPKAIRDRWNPDKIVYPLAITPAELAGRKELFEKYLALVSAMHRAGVEFMAGTDSANPYVVPGFSLHEELQLFVKAGLTPMQALQSATINPAKYLNMQDELGTIEKGKLADLVLLDANPLEDISNTKKINAVVMNGRLLDRKTLDKMLADVEAEANKK